MTSRKKFTMSQYVSLILLFLASMNVFAKYFYFIIIAFIMIVLFKIKRMKIDNTFILLVLFSTLYILFYPEARTGILSIMRQFAYPICYFIGLNFLSVYDVKNKEEMHTQDKITTAITVVALGAFFHYVMNLFINQDSIYRNNIDIWSGEYLNATGQAALSIMAIAIFCTNIFTSKKLYIKIISIIGFVIIFGYNLILAGRSLIIITMLTILTAVIFTLISRDVNNKGRKMIFIVMLFAICVYCYIQNVFGIREIILGSNLSTRMDNMVLLEDVRWSRKWQYIERMIAYPFGGGELHEVVGGYAHELFLDVYSDAGIFAFTVLLGIMCISNGNIISILKKENVSQHLKLLVLCMQVVLILEFMIEPILEGMPWMFCSFCFYHGLLHRFGYTKNKRNNTSYIEQGNVL